MQRLTKIMKCYYCHSKPQSFIILLCNHLVCSKCIPRIEDKGINSIKIKCQCGVVTLFTNDYLLQSNSFSFDETNNQTKAQSTYQIKYDDKQKINKQNIHYQNEFSNQKKYYSPNNLKQYEYRKDYIQRNTKISPRKTTYQQGQSSLLSSSRKSKQKNYLKKLSLQSETNQDLFHQNQKQKNEWKQEKDNSKAKYKVFSNTIKLFEVQYLKIIQQMNNNYEQVLKHLETQYNDMVKRFRNIYVEVSLQSSDPASSITFSKSMKQMYYNVIQTPINHLNDLFYQFLTTSKQNRKPNRNITESNVTINIEKENQKYGSPIVCTYHKSKIGQYHKFMDKVLKKKTLSKKVPFVQLNNTTFG